MPSTMPIKIKNSFNLSTWLIALTIFSYYQLLSISQVYHHLLICHHLSIMRQRAMCQCVIRRFNILKVKKLLRAMMMRKFQRSFLRRNRPRKKKQQRKRKLKSQLKVRNLRRLEVMLIPQVTKMSLMMSLRRKQLPKEELLTPNSRKILQPNKRRWPRCSWPTDRENCIKKFKEKSIKRKKSIKNWK